MCKRDAGYTVTGRQFVKQYDIDSGFPIDCLGCCLAYLESAKNYYTIPDGEHDRVYFMQQDPYPDVRCVVRKSYGPNGKHGQIAVYDVESLGNQRKSTVSNGRNYCLYGPYGGMSIGVEVKARMESVQIDKVRREELAHIYVNYADAALLELYREKRYAQSLRGICMLRVDSVKQEQKEDGDDSVKQETEVGGDSNVAEEVSKDFKGMRLLD